MIPGACADFAAALERAVLREVRWIGRAPAPDPAPRPKRARAPKRPARKIRAKVMPRTTAKAPARPVVPPKVKPAPAPPVQVAKPVLVKQRAPVTCSACGGAGHNKRGCVADQAQVLPEPPVSPDRRALLAARIAARGGGVL